MTIQPVFNTYVLTHDIIMYIPQQIRIFKTIVGFIKRLNGKTQFESKILINCFVRGSLDSPFQTHKISDSILLCILFLFFNQYQIWLSVMQKVKKRKILNFCGNLCIEFSGLGSCFVRGSLGSPFQTHKITDLNLSCIFFLFGSVWNVTICYTKSGIKRKMLIFCENLCIEIEWVGELFRPW